MSLPCIPSLDIIIGPMYSGKTTEIFRRLIIYREISKKVLYINSILDNRTTDAFSTHNEVIKGTIPFDGIKLKNLSDQNVENYDIIAVDEAQFFPDLKDTVINWIEKLGKIVIVGGLNGDFKRHAFGQIIDLIPFCDTITKLTPFCTSCIRKNKVKTAQFTKRTITNGEEILIGGKECYIPVCRECYLS